MNIQEVRGLAQKLSPYLMLAILPGGFILAPLLWLYRRYAAGTPPRAVVRRVESGRWPIP